MPNVVDFPVDALAISCVYCGQNKGVECLASVRLPTEFRCNPHPIRFQMAAQRQCPKIMVEVREIKRSSNTVQKRPYSLISVNFDDKTVTAVAHYVQQEHLSHGQEAVTVNADLTSGADAVSILGIIGRRVIVEDGVDPISALSALEE